MRELSVKPVDRRCRHFPCSDEGFGRRCVERFPETLFRLCRGDFDPFGSLARRMVTLTWASIDFEIVDAEALEWVTEARALRKWQESINIREDGPRLIDAAMKVGAARFGGERKIPPGMVLPREGRAFGAGAFSGSSPFQSMVSLPLLGLAAAVARRSRFAQVEEELRSADARFPDLERRLSRRSAVPSSVRVKRPARRRPADFSHLANH